MDNKTENKQGFTSEMLYACFCLKGRIKVLKEFYYGKLQRRITILQSSINLLRTAKTCSLFKILVDNVLLKLLT